MSSPTATEPARTPSPAGRMAEALRLVGEIIADGQATHPAGCIALTGFYDDQPQRLFWYGRGSCPVSHPGTLRGLRVQRARRGWPVTFTTGTTTPGTAGAATP